MLDSDDLVAIASIFQTVVITLTLAVFIFQFRSQEKSIQESAVQSVMGRYTDYIRMLVERPELAVLLGLGSTDPATPPKDLTAEDQLLSAYLLLGYGIFEEVYALHKKKWMDDETWDQWSAFLARMAGNPIFQRVHRFTTGTFDKDFQDYVSKLIDEAKVPEGSAA